MVMQGLAFRLFAVLGLAALAACAPMEWTRDDATAEQAAADTRACREQAFRETTWSSFGFYGGMGPGLYSDPFGRRYFGWPSYGAFADPFGDRFMEEARLASFCMRAKGYELAPLRR
jgi:hypothetical protein